jgi:hypothetical protein
VSNATEHQVTLTPAQVTLLRNGLAALTAVVEDRKWLPWDLYSGDVFDGDANVPLALTEERSYLGLLKHTDEQLRPFSHDQR